MQNFINLYPSREKFYTPEEFIKMTEEEKRNIEDSRIIPPQLGRGSFGGILVKFRVPVYSAEVCKA